MFSFAYTPIPLSPSAITPMPFGHGVIAEGERGDRRRRRDTEYGVIAERNLPHSKAKVQAKGYEVGTYLIAKLMFRKAKLRRGTTIPRQSYAPSLPFWLPFFLSFAEGDPKAVHLRCNQRRSKGDARRA